VNDHSSLYDPKRNQEIDWYKHHLPEEEEQEHVNRKEYTDHPT
jgi:hypothetical protein